MSENTKPRFLTEANKRLITTNEYRSIAVLAQWILEDSSNKSEAATYQLLTDLTSTN